MPRHWTKKISEQYKRDLNHLLDQIYKAAERRDLTYNDLARLSGLHRSTVYRIGNRETHQPYFSTCYKLAKVVGMRIQLIATRARHTAKV